MRRQYLLPAFSVLSGIAGAFIRAAELSRAFEPETGLPVPGESVSVLMSAFTAAAIIVFAVVSMFFRGCMRDGLDHLSGAGSMFTKILTAASAFMLVAAAVFDLAANSGDTPLSRVVLVALAIFAAISILIRMAKPGRDHAVFSLVPIFWCCFWLILIYRDRSIDPVIPDYIYELLAVVAAALFFYGSAGYDFGSRKFRQIIFFGCAAIYLCIVTAAGSLLAKVLYGAGIAGGDVLLYFAACALYALGCVVWYLDPFNRDFARSGA